MARRKQMAVPDSLRARCRCNALLENGHAVRKDDFSLENWDEVPAAVPK
ncbi:MAG: hypothetical protein Q7S40_15845 [Opitutaceae bacterium]|nr:hypothetical protein [Opitutaceae bacterium]